MRLYHSTRLEALMQVLRGKPLVYRANLYWHGHHYTTNVATHSPAGIRFIQCQTKHEHT